MPVMQETSGKAKKYAFLKYSLNIVGTAYLLFLLAVFTASGLSLSLASWLSLRLGSPYSIFPVYLLIISLAYALLDFPLNFCHSYLLEHKFSLSRQSFPAWLWEQLKFFLVAYLMGAVLLGAFYLVVRVYPRQWWLVVSLLWIFFSLVMARLTPVLIIPLFFKYKKLEDEELRRRILNLADKMKIKLMDCFEIDFSKKTLKANAAFLGLGSSKRVLLADTLKEKYTHQEIEVIVAHEFAHYRKKHLLKLILINSAIALFTFYLIARTSGFVLGFFSLSGLSEIASLPIVLIYFILFGFLMQPWGNLLSRRMERSADYTALSVTGEKEAFISTMKKLAEQNLADTRPHPLIKFFFYDHPPIAERIEMAESFSQSKL